MKVHGYGALKEKAELSPFTFERREPREDDVVIKILYCGICHTDIHQVANDWGIARYPMVPGHEIVGEVTAVGSKVSRFRLGDSVAVGYMVDSCQHCHPCQNHLENYCEEGMTDTFNSLDRQDGTVNYGGYSETIIVKDQFVLKVPANLDLKAVAPIVCAGITVWSPLQHWGVKKGSKVAILGLGGLGHMALKLARSLGADVTLISRSSGKKEEAIRLGAHHVVLSGIKEEMDAVKNKFDLIVDTIPYHHDIAPYLKTLSVDGALVMVGFIGKQESFHTAPLITGRRTIAGSNIGGIKETQELLDFCGKHNITADIEIIKIQEINEAYGRMVKSDVKYRFVIDMSSLVG